MNVIKKLKQMKIKTPWKKFYNKSDLKIEVLDIKIITTLICGIATFSAIQESYYIKIRKR